MCIQNNCCSLCKPNHIAGLINNCTVGSKCPAIKGISLTGKLILIYGDTVGSNLFCHIVCIRHVCGFIAGIRSVLYRKAVERCPLRDQSHALRCGSACHIRHIAAHIQAFGILIIGNYPANQTISGKGRRGQRFQNIGSLSAGSLNAAPILSVQSAVIIVSYHNILFLIRSQSVVVKNRTLNGGTFSLYICCILRSFGLLVVLRASACHRIQDANGTVLNHSIGSNRQGSVSTNCVHGNQAIPATILESTFCATDHGYLAKDRSTAAICHGIEVVAMEPYITGQFSGVVYIVVETGLSGLRICRNLNFADCIKVTTVIIP